MKQKISIVIITSLLLLSPVSSAMAIDFGKAFSKLSKDKESINLNGIDDKIMKKIDQKIEDVTSDIKDKIAAEEKKIRGIINEAEGYVQQARNLKAKAEKYIMIAKIIVGALFSGIIILLFFVWKTWRNVVNMKKTFKAVVNYDEIQQRIAVLEKRVQELNPVQKQ